MTLIMLIIGCIAITVGVAGLIACITDALSPARSIRERDARDRETEER